MGKEFVKNLTSNIEKYGVSIMGVGNEFAYTIGLSKLGFPDLIIFSRDPKMSHWLLNSAFDHIRVNGFKEGICFDVIQDKSGNAKPIFFKSIPITEKIEDEYICQALNFYGQRPDYVGKNGVKLAQVIWPDTDDKFPDNLGYNQDRFEQQLL
jgi:hypothetical protein